MRLDAATAAEMDLNAAFSSRVVNTNTTQL